jgi:hypothetical protein
MRRRYLLVTTVAAFTLLVSPVERLSPQASADTANAPSLVISQLKITSSSGQFVTLYNTTNTTLDMSRYQLEYFNSYDLDKATSSRLISLTGTVPPHGYFMVNDSAMLLCYQIAVDSVSLGLASTAGFIEVLGFVQSGPGGGVTPAAQDYVGWSKTAAVGAQTLPSSTNAFLQRAPVNTQNNPAINQPGAGTWQAVQPDPANACKLVTVSGTPTPVATGFNLLLPSSEPPATIVSLAGDGSALSLAPVMPAGDIGLMTPQITELLPNPKGTGNDKTDEYIELYNANAASFDLSGFKLQSGLSSFRSYTFPSGTLIPAHSFKAFYSKETALSLSNSGGQVKLLDPFGNSISATEVYPTAKDGVAYALAKGKWYWTSTPTPNAANVIKQPVSAKSKTKKSKVAAKTKPGKLKKTAFASDTSDNPTTPINHRLFAAAIAAALLYVAYEYRTDLANRIYQLRRNFARRGASGS